MTHKVYAPSVHLFAFHQRNGLANDSITVAPADSLLWQKCDQIFEKLKIENLKLTQELAPPKESDSRRVLLQKAEGKEPNISPPFDVSLPFDGQILLDESEVVKIAGFAYPLQTPDSYALWLNLRRPDRENGQKTANVEPALLGKLNPDHCLLPEFIDSSLGQTLLITAWLTEGQNSQDKLFLKELADQCVKNFIPDPDKRPSFNRDGLLFGSPIFEYGIINQPPPYRHILVWLLCHSVTEIKFGKCYQELMELFSYRSKIVQAYQTSRTVCKLLSEEYGNIEREIETIYKLSEGRLRDTELLRFKEQLKLIPKRALEYSRFLRDLQQGRHTIRISAQKYEEKVNQIQSKIQSDSLEFLETFSQKNCLYLQEQIQADLNYFEHGVGLLEKMLGAIRGMVEIEHAERERHLQDTIGWLGIGIGTAAVVGSSSAHLTPANPIQPPLTSDTLHPFTASALASVLAGMAAGWVARLFLQRRRGKAAKK
ncbi:MAG: hypothetical protein KME26_30885 [Oscillatoria princeps RMCB-10]|jgi:hypothetical protein|nr:hypothetical protein [Oscillatoria princeps RMCB-10]